MKHIPTSSNLWTAHIRFSIDITHILQLFASMDVLVCYSFFIEISEPLLKDSDLNLTGQVGMRRESYSLCIGIFLIVLNHVGVNQ